MGADRDIQAAAGSTREPAHAAPPGHAEGASRARMGSRGRRVRRPRIWQEVLFILVSYYIYSLVRNWVPAHENVAINHAHQILDFERALRIDIELSINHFFDSLPPLAVIADYYYATLHFVVVIGVLVWVYIRHPLRYRHVRTVLYVTTLIAIFGFWLFPLAPPRMLAGYVDTLVKYHTWGSLASGSVEKVSNQFAAMPSLHIGWSMWAGITIAVLAPWLWVRILGGLYPVFTLLVIMGTANHFVLDAAGGALVLGLGFLVQRLLSGHSPYAQPRGEEHEQAEDPPPVPAAPVPTVPEVSLNGHGPPPATAPDGVREAVTRHRVIDLESGTAGPAAPPFRPPYPRPPSDDAATYRDP